MNSCPIPANRWREPRFPLKDERPLQFVRVQPESQPLDAARVDWKHLELTRNRSERRSPTPRRTLQRQNLPQQRQMAQPPASEIRRDRHGPGGGAKFDVVMQPP